MHLSSLIAVICFPPAIAELRHWKTNCLSATSQNFCVYGKCFPFGTELFKLIGMSQKNKLISCSATSVSIWTKKVNEYLFFISELLCQAFFQFVKIYFKLLLRFYFKLFCHETAIWVFFRFDCKTLFQQKFMSINIQYNLKRNIF